jgi:hypothetical protein
MSSLRYIDALPLAPVPRLDSGLDAPLSAPRRSVSRSARSPSDTPAAAVDGNALLSFVDGITPQQRDDVLFSVQLALRGASGAFDRFAQTETWYKKYTEILERLGWTSEQFAFARHDQQEGELRMDQAALALIAAVATQNQLAVLNEAIHALETLAEDDKTLRLFDFHTSTQTSGNFQIGAVQAASNGALSMALGAFYFKSRDARRHFLFFKWGAKQLEFWTAAQRLTLNTTLYAPLRDAVKKKLGLEAQDFISDLSL